VVEHLFDHKMKVAPGEVLVHGLPMAADPPGTPRVSLPALEWRSEFTLEKPHGRVDYLPFVNGQPAGLIEAKPEGTTVVKVEHQSRDIRGGLPPWMTPPVYPLPFIYESSGPTFASPTPTR
jgi:hypothetical protein